MIALVADARGDTATRDAFLEEDPGCVVVDPDADIAATAVQVTEAAATVVAPTTPATVASARRLGEAAGLPVAGGAVPLDRERQHAAVAAHGPVAEPNGHTPTTPDGTRLSVDLVSVGGCHVNAGVHAQRVDVAGGRALLRHRITLAPDGPEAVAALAFACACLDAFGVRDGATTLELELGPSGPAPDRSSSDPCRSRDTRRRRVLRLWTQSSAPLRRGSVASP